MRCCVDLIKFLLFLANFLCFVSCKMTPVSHTNLKTILQLAFAGLLAGTVYILTNGEKTFIGKTNKPK